MEHEYYAMTVQEAEVISQPDSEPVVVLVGEAETVVGCNKCGMVLGEAVTLPCFGMPLEQVLDEVD